MPGNTEDPHVYFIKVYYLEEGGMTLQLGRAKRSHWTQVRPEVDVGQQRTGSEQQTRWSLHIQKPKRNVSG